MSNLRDNSLRSPVGFLLGLVVFLSATACSPAEESNLAEMSLARQCHDTRTPGILELLSNEVGSEVCVMGPITVGMHEVAFPTVPLVETDAFYLYGNRLYVLLTWRDAIDAGLQNGEVVELTGILELHDGFDCTESRCPALDLRLE